MFILMYSFVVPAAGNAFCQAALLHLQMQSKHDAATNFIDAGNAFKKADPQGLFCFCSKKKIKKKAKEGF